MPNGARDIRRHGRIPIEDNADFAFGRGEAIQRGAGVHDEIAVRRLAAAGAPVGDGDGEASRGAEMLNLVVNEGADSRGDGPRVQSLVMAHRRGPPTAGMVRAPALAGSPAPAPR